jgi:hypothetical protein
MGIFLDSLPPLCFSVGYGGLGTTGALGYEGKAVQVLGKRYTHALSTHAPARLRYRLDGRFRSLRCYAALNDDVPTGQAHGDFQIFADERRIATAFGVTSGQEPREMIADLSGAQEVELVVTSGRWENSHTIWLNPELSEEPPQQQPTTTLLDPLQRVEIAVPHPLPITDRCVATVVSPGFESYLEHMLRSFRTCGGCDDALLVVLAVEPNETCRAIAERYGALVVPCIRRGSLSVALKAALYSIAHIVQARQYLCLDADMLVLSSLVPIFDTLDALPDRTILVCRESNTSWGSLDNAIRTIYRGESYDFTRLLGSTNGEASYPLVVNDGIFAGSADALLALDVTIRLMPQAIGWMEEKPKICWWRNQFIFNLALARLKCGVALDDVWNVQLHMHEVQLAHCECRGASVLWRGRPVRVLHFCGQGKHKYQEWGELFAKKLLP